MLYDVVWGLGKPSSTILSVFFNIVQRGGGGGSNPYKKLQHTCSKRGGAFSTKTDKMVKDGFPQGGAEFSMTTTQEEIFPKPEHIYFVVRPGSRPDDYDPIWLIQLIIIWPQRVDADASIDV